MQACRGVTTYKRMGRVRVGGILLLLVVPMGLCAVPLVPMELCGGNGGILIDINNDKEGLMSFVVIININSNNKYRYVPLWYLGLVGV